ncbi:vegetative cell wall protein gp1-like [Impatiens glandulifera]|uniref:vegetative cell wall protein gp1-like n=1 Tax=Impatiens glandulifera TaxID=253017 RepID=UPI001FB0F480|nr:vegetative cell wall protein gp1-like [Impatiens glandulifera]
MPPSSNETRVNLLVLLLCFCLTALCNSTTANAIRKPSISSMKHNMIKQFKHISDENMDTYIASSPLTLPQYDSLSPSSLPNRINSNTNSPPYCVYPPYALLPPPGAPPVVGPSGPPTVSLPNPITPVVGQPGSPSISVPSPVTPVVGPPGSPSISVPSPVTPMIGPPGPPSVSVPNPITPVMGPPGPPLSVPSPVTPVINPPGSPSTSVPSPITPITGPPSGLTPSPSIFLPPIVYPPPAVPPPPHRASSMSLWCVAKPTVPDPIIQEAMNYACGSGADCNSVQPNGPCFQPNTLLAHASYAFNSYWQRTKVAGGTCEFGGTAILVTVDPSYDGCHFLYF